MSKLDIVCRRPRHMAGIKDAYWVVIRRDDKYHPWVVATVHPLTLRNNEWHQGAYFADLVDAMADFNTKVAGVRPIPTYQLKQEHLDTITASLELLTGQAVNDLQHKLAADAEALQQVMQGCSCGLLLADHPVEEAQRWVKFKNL